MFSGVPALSFSFFLSNEFTVAPLHRAQTADLGGAEAEGRHLGVGPLRVHDHEPLLLVQAQVASRGDVSHAERHTPLHVTAAPARQRRDHNTRSDIAHSR